MSAMPSDPHYFPEGFDISSAAIAFLSKRSLTLNFSPAFDHLPGLRTGPYMSPGDLIIRNFFRFEGQSDPVVEEIVYALASSDGQNRAIPVNTIGINSAETSVEIIRKLS